MMCEGTVQTEKGKIHCNPSSPGTSQMSCPFSWRTTCKDADLPHGLLHERLPHHCQHVGKFVDCTNLWVSWVTFKNMGDDTYAYISIFFSVRHYKTVYTTNLGRSVIQAWSCMHVGMLIWKSHASKTVTCLPSSSHNHHLNNSLPHCPTLSPTVATILYFFLWNFSYFIAIFHLQKHTFVYLKVDTGPWKQCPMLSPTVSTTAELTNSPYSPAWVIATGAKNNKFFCWN